MSTEIENKEKSKKSGLRAGKDTLCGLRDKWQAWRDKAEAKALHRRTFHQTGALQRSWEEKVCTLTVAKWKLCQKIDDLKWQAMNRLYMVPGVAAAAEFTYLLGFWAEYSLLEVGRKIQILGRLCAKSFGRLYSFRIYPVLAVVGGFLNDLVQPIIQSFRGIRTLYRARRKMLVGPDGKPQKLTFGRAITGLARYVAVLVRGFSCLLPFAALAVMVFVVRDVISYKYVLAVQVNDAIVGYVESEQVFDAAKENVNQRVEQAKASMASIDSSADTQRNWNVDSSFTLCVSTGYTMSESAMADAILRASSDQIQEATALYVDGSLRAVTTEGDKLRAYMDESDPTLRVEFVRELELVDGVYFTDSIVPYSSIVEMLEGKEQEEKLYEVKAGDTPWTIANNNELTLNELYEMNPQMTESGYNMYVGDKLVVAREVDFLQVMQVYTRTWQEEVDYQTITTKSSDYDWGTTKVLVSGSKGLKEITADITYINGVKTSTVVLNETMLVEPVNREVIKGTRLRSGMVASYGSGNFVWPVPNYTYVSRWMSSSHKGADICAPYGVPIIASDAGVVVTSARHWSYGNYVEIDHGNGYRTLYAHMSSRAVSVGQAVGQGQVIGYIGSTGVSTGNHCHFEMYYNGVRFSARNLFGGMRAW